MGHADIPKIEELGAELNFWNAYRKLQRAKGFDPDQVLKEWAVEEERSLTSPGPREEFAELCKHGCLPQGLALLIALLRSSPLLETFWVEMVGKPDKRDRTARALENAAHTLCWFGRLQRSSSAHVALTQLPPLEQTLRLDDEHPSCNECGRSPLSVTKPPQKSEIAFL